ncbi:suppressor of fused homolog [Haliotis rufescens]|uniref:suppressor of fused homolog n=1 Tax=Haliotis rufescens TaxID=6454 RepID=UPI00201EE506|nr:suppressor of fused homolog [Haliotis rufescens]
MEAESFGDLGVSGRMGDSSEESDDLDECDSYGYEAIDRSCKIVYADQLNPLQYTPRVQIWLGGPDPLDIIRIYSNEGDLSKSIPPHWHFITFGFSDLYGDERVHRRVERGEPSGFGFELTLRVRRNIEDTDPPDWGSTLINKLARYVFHTGNVLHVGDHIPWHKPLDGESCCRIQHMLVAEDPQLLDLDTPYGTIEFRQLVGVMDEEIKAAQKWKGAGMLHLLQESPDVGPFFVTDMDRKKSLFEKNPSLQAMVMEGIEKDGSNMGHVTAVFRWRLLNQESGEHTPKRSLKMKETGATPADNNNDNKENIVLDEDQDDDLLHVEPIDAVQLCFDAEAAELLPMVVKARLKKGRFFIFRSADNHAVHLVPSTHDQTVFVNDVQPMKAMGTDLQIFCTQALIEEMSEALEELQTVDEDLSRYPKLFQFSSPSVQVAVYPRGQLSMSRKDSPPK